jgi:hypothetical protein
VETVPAVKPAIDSIEELDSPWRSVMDYSRVGVYGDARKEGTPHGMEFANIMFAARRIDMAMSLTAWFGPSSDRTTKLFPLPFPEAFVGCGGQGSKAPCDELLSGPKRSK